MSIPFLDLDTSYKGVYERIADAFQDKGFDLTEGSVLRTITETMCREIATFYAKLERAYMAGYLETAEGEALDKVVSILGTERIPADQLSGSVVFGRLSPAPRDIIIPMGFHITGPGLESNRVIPVFETIGEYCIDKGKTGVTAKVRAMPDTADETILYIPPHSLTIMPRPIMGIESVTNYDPITRRGEAETDGQLRSRARIALRTGQKATLETIEAAVKEMNVERVEALEHDEGTPGRVMVRIGDPDLEKAPDRVARIEQAVYKNKAAGIRAEIRYISPVYFKPEFPLEPLDPNIDENGFNQLKNKSITAMDAFFSNHPVGEPVSERRLIAVILGVPGVRDIGKIRMTTYSSHAAKTEEGLKDDTNIRELPDGLWYLEEMENAALIKKEHLGDDPASLITRYESKEVVLNISMLTVSSDLPLDTIKKTIKATINRYVAGLKRDTVRAINLKDMTGLLKGKAFVKQIQSAQFIRVQSGRVELFDKNDEFNLEPDERFSVGNIIIKMEEG